MSLVTGSVASFALEGSALPSDALAAQFHAMEGISTPYAIVVEFETQDPAFREDDCLRTRARLAATDIAGETRYFDGIVDQARFVHVVGDRRFFEVRLRPALAALAHREGCRLFQEKTVVQVVQLIFNEAGFGDRVAWRTKHEYEPREMIVQYRESHLNFVSCLLEETSARAAPGRQRALRASADTCKGESRALGLRVGAPFVVDGAAEAALDGEFVVTHLTTRGKQTMSAGETNRTVENELRAIPAGVPFAAEQRAVRPRIRRLQTAIVTGSSKQEQLAGRPWQPPIARRSA